MPQKVIKFKGINRTINEYYTSGECEELVNLRPKSNGGMCVVKPKSAIHKNINYEQYYEHAFSKYKNYIAVVNGNVIWVNSPKGEKSITSDFVGNISISFAGNVMIIYSRDDQEQLVYKFRNNDYEPYKINTKPITDVKVQYQNTIITRVENTEASDEFGYRIPVEAANNLLSLAVSSFYSNYPNGLCGAVIFGFTYELDDGSEIWSTAFLSVDNSYINGHQVPSFDNDYTKLSIRGLDRIKLIISFGDGISDGVKRINIYSSNPVMPYRFVNSGLNPYAERYSFDKEDQLMYYQGSITANEREVEFTPSFGISLSGGKTMDVLPGCIERIGDIMSYNNRFHYYNSELRHTLQVPMVSNFNNENIEEYWVAYVNIENKWYLIDHLYTINSSKKNDFIYPMAGISRLRFVKASKTDNGFTVPYEDVFTINLKESKSYNYSYAFDVIPNVVPMADDFYDELVSNGQIYTEGFVFTKVVNKIETNTINVSDQFNPFSFPVQYSYSFGGNIIDIATSYLPVSSVQIGQYPLTVFTTNGIYAMEQGDGTTLYSNIVPLQPLVSRGRSVSTPHGIFFLASDNMYLLYGREISNVSEILHGELEQNIRNLNTYKKLCLSSDNNLLDFSSVLSDVEFKSFIANASLTYDPLHDEVIISNRDIRTTPKSYVLNIPAKSYHKICKTYAQFQNGGRYILEDSYTDRNIIDLHKETDGAVEILLQSRPMALDALYSHLQRVLLLADAKLTGNQYMFVSVFASDNLHDWKCIISAQKRDTVFKHVRTNKAAKSYKDYIVLINGLVSTDTDISDLIADYTIVQRRLG